ncbi:hypothetical protein C0992_000115, partial [Termitomyces sp. T32_za158]
HTPITPGTREHHTKRARITIPATPPSIHIQNSILDDMQLISQPDGDIEMPDFHPQRLFSDVLQSEIATGPLDDIFGPTPPLPPQPPQPQPQPFPMQFFAQHLPA